LELKLQDQETKSLVSNALRESLLSILKSDEVKNEFKNIIDVEQKKLREEVIFKIQDQKELVIQYVRKQQSIEINEKIKEKERLEKIIEENNKIIDAKRGQLNELTIHTEIEQKKIMENSKMIEDEKRFKELQEKLNQEQEKNKIINRSKTRNTITFSMH